jgi:MYXO-CTERM domain-containing protein
MYRKLIKPLLCFVAITSLGIVSASAGVVTDGGDAGANTLRDAIAAAAPDETITFSGVSTVTLTSAELLVDKNLTIDGGGSVEVTRSGATQFRIFRVTGATNVTITGLTISNGHAPDGASGSMGGDGEFGGGIRNDATLVLRDVVLSSNRAGDGGTGTMMGGFGGRGGGVFNEGTLTAERVTLESNSAGAGGAGDLPGSDGYGGGIGSITAISVTSSTFNGNYGRTGGGLYVWSDSVADITGCTFMLNESVPGASIYVTGDGYTVRITNSTISGNTGGGIELGNPGNTFITHSTIADNTGDGVHTRCNGLIQLYLRNTIVFGNAADCVKECASGINSDGYNLVTQGSSCPSGSAGDLTTTDAGLLGLSDNGGPTKTRGLGPGSPAINQGICTDRDGNTVATDQRGMTRPEVPGAACDIGAYEMMPTVVLRVTEEPAGDNCPYGGILLEYGMDLNDNGILDPGEETSQIYICSAYSTLVSISDEPPGDNCPSGGKLVEYGVDTDASGVLDVDEVVGTYYICNGSDGADGADGNSTLISIQDEPAGDNCPNGGKMIEVGVDDNGDGTLDAGEVDETTYVCDGADGDSALVSTTDEPAGDNCENGGTRIDVGIDDNDNGTLDTDEVDQTTYVCNGTDGTSQLLRITDEQAGTNCEKGGVKIESGVDANGNGTLEDSEVNEAATQYMCDDDEDDDDGGCSCASPQSGPGALLFLIAVIGAIALRRRGCGLVKN